LLVLASSSPYRRALLERLHVPFEIVAPQVDESPLEREAPRATALRLAELKARAGAIGRGSDIVIGSDQVACMGNTPIGKPGNRDAALAQLRAMRGRVVEFHTALCVLDAASSTSEVENVPTIVRFRSFSDAQAERYLDLDQPYDCAGSAKIEALGIALVESVESADPTALIGLPLIALVAMLARLGIDVP
jgi:septum formation protein